MQHRPWLRYALAVTLLAPAPMILHAASITAQAPEAISVAREVRRDTSRPMREILAELPTTAPSNPADYVVPNKFLDLDDQVLNPANAPTPPAQRSVFGDPTPATNLAVNGMRIGLGGGGVPPDTTGDIGATHYFQWVNTSWALFDKTTGALTDGPFPGNSFFSGFGGLCDTTDRGDPLVLWDDQARRWVVSQFAFTTTNAAPWLQCVAVSTTEDPLGSYHRYAFEYPNFNDYGKMGVWSTEDGGQNAYLFSMHEFAPDPGGFAGSSFAVVERDRMLNGESAQFIRFGGLPIFGAIPFHLEGENSLPSGTCPVFVHFSSGASGYQLWDLCVDWLAGSAAFDPIPTFITSEPYTVGLNGIPQMDSTTRLDDFGGNTMYIAALRAYGATGPSEANGVIHHAVDVGGDQAGARWVKFGISAGTPSTPGGGDSIFASGFENAFIPAIISNKRIIDQGTYAPDSDSRWMGSINIDQSGNIAMGYNVASETLNPEIRVAGKLRVESPGVLRDEAQCSPTGTGAQTGLFGGRARWGDYSSVGVDPDDQCTFWVTGEFYTTTSNSTWNTRICSLSFPECGDPDFLLEVTPNSRVAVCGVEPTGSVRAGEFGILGSNVALSEGSVPAGVSLSFSPTSIAAGESSAMTVAGATGLADGLYSLQVDGTDGALTRSVSFDIGVSATAPGAPTLTGPVLTETGTATRPTYTWTAGSGANDYMVEVALDAGFTQIVDSETVSGTSYISNILLNSSTLYFWRVTPINFCGSGAVSATFNFTTGVPGQCPTATISTQLFFDDIEGDAIAWTTENVSGDPGTAWAKQTPPAGTGLATRAWFAGNSSTDADQRLISPPINLGAAGLAPITLVFDAYHQYETDGGGCFDGGFVEVSIDAGANWAELGDARNLADPYTGPLTATGESAWCVQPPGSVVTIFTLDDFTGETVQLRFRSLADANTVGADPNGWGVDNVLVQRCDDDD